MPTSRPRRRTVRTGAVARRQAWNRDRPSRQRWIGPNPAIAQSLSQPGRKGQLATLPDSASRNGDDHAAEEERDAARHAARRVTRPSNQTDIGLCWSTRQGDRTWLERNLGPSNWRSSGSVVRALGVEPSTSNASKPRVVAALRIPGTTWIAQAVAGCKGRRAIERNSARRTTTASYGSGPGGDRLRRCADHVKRRCLRACSPVEQTRLPAVWYFACLRLLVRADGWLGPLDLRL